MNEPSSNQLELDFASSGPCGISQWREQRQAALDQLARQMGLPLGHQVEVWIRGGIRLCGKLQLREELLFLNESQKRDMRLELTVDGVTFTPVEIESCLRTD